MGRCWPHSGAQGLKHARTGIPPLIVLDDVHNADAGALLLTRFVAGALDRLPLVLLLTRRDGGAGTTLLDELAREATVVPLRRFTMQETAALLAAHGQRDDGDRVTAALHQVTGGYRCSSPAPSAVARAPSTVQEAIAGALARLPAAPVRQHVLAMQRAALAALPEQQRSLRCRLSVRLAAEAVYEGGAVDAVFDALAQARSLGEPRTLAEALSLAHHALLGRSTPRCAARLPIS